MTIWNVTECAATDLRDFDLAWLPSGLPPQIRQYRKSNRVGLEIDTIVGSVPLRNGDTLQINPKIGAANFLRMLLESEFSDNSPQERSESLVSYQNSDELTLASLVVRPFVNSLKTIDGNSFRFGWLRNVEQGETPSADIMILPTAIGLRTRSEKPFTYVNKTRTLNIPENRVLRSAAALVISRHQHLLSKDSRDFVARFLRREDIGPTTPRDVDVVKAALASSSYTGARGYYEASLKLGLILLAQDGFRQGDAEDLRAESVLFNSADVFEKFVRLAIARRYQQTGLTVRKNFFPPRSLFKDGSGLLQPDIVIMRDDSIRLIADVKYKSDGASASDLYQAHVYAQRAKVDFIVFFCASDSSELHVTRRASYLDLTVFELFLPVSDLEMTSRCLRQIERSVPLFRPY